MLKSIRLERIGKHTCKSGCVLNKDCTLKQVACIESKFNKILVQYWGCQSKRIGS